MKFNENGRSMIEMLGVLAIIGVLSVGGIMAFRVAMNKHKNNTILNGLSHTVNNVKTLFLQQDNVKGLTTEEAYKAGIVPDEFKLDENVKKLVHAYGGNVEIVAKTLDGEDADPDSNGSDVVYYAIRITGLPKDVAMQIATQNWGGSGDLVSVNLNNEGQDTDSSNTPNPQEPSGN